MYIYWFRLLIFIRTLRPTTLAHFAIIDIACRHTAYALIHLFDIFHMHPATGAAHTLEWELSVSLDHFLGIQRYDEAAAIRLLLFCVHEIHAFDEY